MPHFGSLVIEITNIQQVLVFCHILPAGMVTRATLYSKEQVPVSNFCSSPLQQNMRWCRQSPTATDLQHSSHDAIEKGAMHVHCLAVVVIQLLDTVHSVGGIVCLKRAGPQQGCQRQVEVLQAHTAKAGWACHGQRQYLHANKILPSDSSKGQCKHCADQDYEEPLQLLLILICNSAGGSSNLVGASCL